MKNTEMMKKNYEFKHVLSRGKPYFGEYLMAFILKNDTEQNYLGLAISTKIGKAYQRNRTKRLIRENYKNIEPEITLGFSMVFLVKKDVQVDNLDFDNIKKDMMKIFLKSGLIIEKSSYEKNIN